MYTVTIFPDYTLVKNKEDEESRQGQAPTFPLPPPTPSPTHHAHHRSFMRDTAKHSLPTSPPHNPTLYTVPTLPDDRTPLMRTRKTRSQERARQPSSSQRMPPMFSIPSEICSTWFLKQHVFTFN